MTVSQRPQGLRARLSTGRIVLAPGVFDPLTASIATDAGFEALYLSGAAIAYTKLGRPDIGLVTMSEVADTLAHIRERVETPLIVDADGAGLQHLRALYRPDLYRFRMELVRAGERSQRHWEPMPSAPDPLAETIT